MANTKEVAMLFDSSHCTGCKGCQVACKQWNMLPSKLGLNENKFSGTYQNPPDLNGDTRLVMTFDEKESGNKYQPINFAIGRRSCYHCTDAACPLQEGERRRRVRHGQVQRLHVLPVRLPVRRAPLPSDGRLRGQVHALHRPSRRGRHPGLRQDLPA